MAHPGTAELKVIFRETMCVARVRSLARVLRLQHIYHASAAPACLISTHHPTPQMSRPNAAIIADPAGRTAPHHWLVRDRSPSLPAPTCCFSLTTHTHTFVTQRSHQTLIHTRACAHTHTHTHAHTRAREHAHSCTNHCTCTQTPLHARARKTRNQARTRFLLTPTQTDLKSV